MTKRRDQPEDHTLARREGSVLARHGARQDLAAALDEELLRPDGKARAMEAILTAARALAPVFSVTSVKDPAADSRSDDEAHPIENTAVIVEVLFSAGAYLAHARGMTKAELFEKFEEWARDNGFD